MRKVFYTFLFFIYYFLFTSPVFAQNAPLAIPTFNSISLYWNPSGGSASTACQVKYRPQGSSAWMNGQNLWYSGADGYRGSLVNLTSNTAYEIQLNLSGGSPATISTNTWNENFPIAQTIKVPYGTSTYTVSNSGSASSYILYIPDTMPSGVTANLDAKNSADYNIVVQAHHVIIRGFKLTGARSVGIYLPQQSSNTYDVVIENNEIWNWGNGTNMEGAISAGGTGENEYWLLNPNIKRIITQRNLIHSPRYSSNDWRSGHPGGPQAIALFNTGGQNVIRYNEVYSGNGNYYNDILGAGANEDVGYPGADSDIYGNKLANCWDDGIESDGNNQNVRIWNNYVTNCLNAISIAPIMKGPLYIWRNIVGSLAEYPGGYSTAGGLVKTGTVAGGSTFSGRVYLYHNTLLQPQISGVNTGARNAIYNGPTQNVISRNNIFQMQNSGNSLFSVTDSSNDLNYDLYYGNRGSWETNGISGAPTFLNGANLTSGYFLDTSSKGYNSGVVLSNFNDVSIGTPDMGAYENGLPPLEFGINAYTSEAHCSPLGNIDCAGRVNALDFAYLISKWGATDQKANLNDAGNVDSADLKILLDNFGKSQ